MKNTPPFRNILCAWLLVGLFFFTPGAGTHPGNRQAPVDPGVQNQSSGTLQDFGVVSVTEGWVLAGNRLYRTNTNGLDWQDLTPALPPDAAIYAAQFRDASTGWLLWSHTGTDANLVLQLTRTSNQGRNWKDSIIQTFKPDDPNAAIENASIDWLDEQTGWVSVKRQTGSNFSAGTLFQTIDGGQTWTTLDLPIGEPVHFVDSQVGWVAGGPAGDDLFKTQDAGKTWNRQPVPGGSATAQRNTIIPPVFDSPGNGLLPVITQMGDESQFKIFSTRDGGRSWISITSIPLDSQPGMLPLSWLDAHGLVASIPNSDRIIRMIDGDIEIIHNRDGRSAGIVDLKMRTFNLGWAMWQTGGCTKQAVGAAAFDISCNSSTQLIETRDGGVTWERIPIPDSVSGMLTLTSQIDSTVRLQAGEAGPGKTILFAGQGFDQCEITTLPNLQTWWNSSPYQSVNLYIGGISRGCSNSALTADYVNRMRQQGWAFIPTWVGPQAPCTDYSHTFTYDNAYTEGRDEAYFASTRLAQLGLTNPDKSGSVVYYDMEIYGNDADCRQAVNDFVNGWVTHMHDLGNLAGVYGATGVVASNGCTSGLGDYLTIPNIPDVIWPARWYLPAGEGTFDPTASVWDIGKCVPATAWNNHQRIRQYAGGHNETWGGVLLNIDSNVLDGVVAIPYPGTPSPEFSAAILSDPPLTVKFTIANTAFMSICTWDYGDGQTGSSCANISTHTYASPGSYVVRLTVSSVWGAENLSSSIPVMVSAYQMFLPLVRR